MRRLKFVQCGGTGLSAEGTGRCIDCHMSRIDDLFDRNTSSELRARERSSSVPAIQYGQIRILRKSKAQIH